jgi:hypothetical protein
MFFCSFTPGLGSPWNVGSWWLERIAFQKAFLFACLVEVLGFGCMSGPLTVLLEFQAQFPDEASCWAHLRRAPWPRADSTFSATRPCWSKGNGGCDDSMKLRLSSCGCEARPAKGEPARTGSEPGDGLGNEAGEA